MSLILEALKKLEREKRSTEPGFLVLGPTSWPSAARGRPAVVMLVAGLALLAGTLAVLASRRGGEAAPDSRATLQPPPAASPATAVASVGATLPPAGTALRPLVTATPAPAPGLLPKPEEDHVASPENESLPVRVAEPAIRAAAEPSAPSSEAAQPRYRLQAISMRDGKPVAVLNDRLVYEGDSLDGFRLVRIGDAEVELEVDGQRVVVGF